MSTEEIEAFVRELDEYVCRHELCVYPEKQTFDCCDCYLCRIDYFDKLRRELIESKGD